MYPDKNQNQNWGGNPNPTPPPTPPSGLPPVPVPVTPQPAPFDEWKTPTTGGALVADFWLKKHKKVIILAVIGLLILGDIIFQIVYPSSHLIPGTKVDGLNLGGMRREEAANKLNAAYGGLNLDIYFGKNDAAFQSPKMSDVGISVSNSNRVASLDYPFYLRIVPLSMLWAPGLEKPVDLSPDDYSYDKNKIADYTQAKVGDDCSIAPKNASLKLVDSQLQLVPSATGGKCDITQFQQTLAQVKPNPDKQNSVRIAIDETAAPVSDDMARDLAAKLNARLGPAMPIAVDNSTDTIPGRVVMSWLDFKAFVPEQTIDNSGNQSASLQFSINNDRMKSYLDQGIASQLIVKPGVSRVTTLDFTEKSRVNGANGRDIDVTKTNQSVLDYINSKIQKAIGVTQVVGPTVIYTRTYTPSSVGFNALLAQYAQDNGGTWSIAFNELSGVEKPRTAQFNGNAQIAAGGIHSVYLGYTDVIQQYNGASRPVDIITGNTTATDCFKLMLQKFDQSCTNGFYDFYGYATIAARGRDLGLQNTTFAGRQTKTSANDLQKVMIGLFRNQIGRTEGAQKVLNTMRSVQQNDGIPAGAGSYSVIHTIGETGTVHNDTGIVYDSDHGNFALTVLTDGASWDKVAGLVKKIEALKQVKIPKGAI